MMPTRSESTAAPEAVPATHLLVVDDIAENRIAMSALLERPGLKVLAAASGEAALELLLRQDVALALLDVQMPGMDGFELAELMRGTGRTRDVPIIFLTATSRDQVRQFRGYEAGAVDYLHKPVDPRIVRSKVAVFVELYEQRRALAQRNAQLVRALELNEMMTAVLAHDLRAPLAAVIAGADAALLAGAGSDVATRSLQTVRRGGQRMSQMISDLLDFSRIRTGQLLLSIQDHDLSEILEWVLDEVRAAHDGARIEVARHGDTRGRFDGGRMSQVLGNLIGNALIHGRQGPITVTIDGDHPELLRVEVRNIGTLPDDTRDQLFQPFRSGGVRRGSGLGLGLYIASQFVLAHGGEIEGRSDGDVTVFSFRLRRRPHG